ncbi:hypothetical protein P152DRAFT_18727 [Eremomyces bilateralis CBS 781.70]|uniref:Uncharacterized protein n=1 Tax=Eremomyces bilateralis CBS 781.70 TaxID=1392243 RepID=A0A6G1GHT7_9PEZI|nr:uncharacterized protein P152DRAFT_18727 [Eremomyces bilateralis CBS 781.70]KAF1817430.1 hypothetical protein P152DRAFT_18727 [Eremomyces bilateralis CBS 781.70]
MTSQPAKLNLFEFLHLISPIQPTTPSGYPSPSFIWLGICVAIVILVCIFDSIKTFRRCFFL